MDGKQGIFRLAMLTAVFGQEGVEFLYHRVELLDYLLVGFVPGSVLHVLPVVDQVDVQALYLVDCKFYIHQRFSSVS